MTFISYRSPTITNMVSRLVFHIGCVNRMCWYQILHDVPSQLDSPEHYNRSCFLGTRKQYIADIKNSSCWICGRALINVLVKDRAGAGKPAIAQPSVENLKDIQSDCWSPVRQMEKCTSGANSRTSFYTETVYSCHHPASSYVKVCLSPLLMSVL